MKKTIFTILMIVIMSSCKSVNPSQRDNLNLIENDFCITKMDYVLLDSTSILLSLFEINEKSLDQKVRIKVIDNNLLQVTYINLDGKERKHFFKGEFKKNQFVVFLRRKRLTIPPIIFFRDVYSLKIVVANDNGSTIVIDKYTNQIIVCLLGGAGNGKSNRRYHFKSLE